MTYVINLKGDFLCLNKTYEICKVAWGLGEAEGLGAVVALVDSHLLTQLGLPPPAEEAGKSWVVMVMEGLAMCRLSVGKEGLRTGQEKILYNLFTASIMQFENCIKDGRYKASVQVVG